MRAAFCAVSAPPVPWAGARSVPPLGQGAGLRGHPVLGAVPTRSALRNDCPQQGRWGKWMCVGGVRLA